MRAVEEAVRVHQEELEGTPQNGTDTSSRAPLADPVPLRPAGMHELEELLAEHLATRVRVQEGRAGGKVIIEFAGALMQIGAAMQKAKEHPVQQAEVKPVGAEKASEQEQLQAMRKALMASRQAAEAQEREMQAQGMQIQNALLTK